MIALVKTVNRIRKSAKNHVPTEVSNGAPVAIDSLASKTIEILNRLRPDLDVSTRKGSYPESGLLWEQENASDVDIEVLKTVSRWVETIERHWDTTKL